MTFTWTEDDYDSMGWHDVHVHALRIVEGEPGAGELWLDLDYMLEWACSDKNVYEFRVAPAVLKFRDVTDLRFSLDYAGPSAAFGPFSIDGIERRVVQYQGGCASYRWKIPIAWPAGEITFESPGFQQQLTGPEIVTSSQHLKPPQRTNSW